MVLTLYGEAHPGCCRSPHLPLQGDLSPVLPSTQLRNLQKLASLTQLTPVSLSMDARVPLHTLPIGRQLAHPSLIQAPAMYMPRLAAGTQKPSSVIPCLIC